MLFVPAQFSFVSLNYIGSRSAFLYDFPRYVPTLLPLQEYWLSRTQLRQRPSPMSSVIVLFLLLFGNRVSFPESPRINGTGIQVSR